jgi:ABC-type Fe3+/spermidine/putrescine transport system ATPase subunit
VAEPTLSLQGIEKRFGSVVAVRDLHLAIADGEFVTLLGPSGCGKSTTLALIAGFFPPDAGEIRLKGRNVEDLPPFQRDIGVVFQDYALFPHMTVAQNVSFGLRMRGLARAEIARRVAEALDLVKLAGLDDRRPLRLSGGQRQRVALARALLAGAQVLVLDDPMSAVDTETERLLVENLRPAVAGRTVLLAGQRLSTILVADRAAVLEDGRIVEDGRPADLLRHGGTFTRLFGDETLAA